MMRDVWYVKNVPKGDLEFISRDKRECYRWKELKSYCMDQLEVGKGVILTDDEAYFFTTGAF
jgi:hypothetical protein